MANGVRIEKLTRQGIALMQEERELALRGDLAGLEALNKRKETFLEKMEALAASDKRGHAVSPEQRAELETLFAIIRRRAEENQSILRAAVAGVKQAQRQISALNSQEFELGVYGKDGLPIKPNNEITANSHFA